VFVGVLRLTLHLPEPGSLKSKRHLLRSALDRVKARFNVSIAEVGDNDLWQRSVVGVAAVGNDHAFVNETLDKVADFVTSVHGGQIHVLDRSIAIESWANGAGLAEGGRTLADVEAEREMRAGGMGEPQPSGTRGGGPPISEEDPDDHA
jgi:uncharacterized protein